MKRSRTKELCKCHQGFYQEGGKQAHIRDYSTRERPRSTIQESAESITNSGEDSRFFESFTT